MAGFSSERVKAAGDIGDLMGLKPGRSWGLVVCPFHPDTAPSCSVDRRKGVFHCFSDGCGCSGDVADYFGFTKYGQNYDRYDKGQFLGALEHGAMILGVSPEERSGWIQARKERPRESVASAVAELMARKMETAPRDSVAERNAGHQARFAADFSTRCRRYLESRGLDPETARQYGAGFRANWQGADRVTFPMTLPDGEVRQFYGRALPGHAETWDHPTEGPIPVSKAAKSSRLGLRIEDDRKIGGWFNAPAFLSERHIVIVEGIPDALALLQCGFLGTVSPIGTNLGAFDPAWFVAVGPLPRPVLIAFNRDKNESGQIGAERAKAKIESEVMGGLVAVSTVLPPEGFNDWADVLERSGAAKIVETLGALVPRPQLARAQAGRDRFLSGCEALYDYAQKLVGSDQDTDAAQAKSLVLGIVRASEKGSEALARFRLDHGPGAIETFARIGVAERVYSGGDLAALALDVLGGEPRKKKGPDGDETEGPGHRPK